MLLLSASAAMASQLHHANHANQALLLQRLQEREASTKKMEKQWRAAAQAAQSGEAKIEQSVLDGVREIMDQIQEQCNTQKDASVNLVQVRKDAVAQCGTDKDAAWRTIEGIWNILREDGAQHQACTFDLCHAEQTRIDTCAARDAKAIQAHGATPNCSPGATCDTDADNCEACLNNAHNWYNSYFNQLDSLINHCVTTTTNSSTWQADCDRLSHTYEEDWCEYRDLLNTKCNLYDQCYSDTASAYDADTENLTAITGTNQEVHFAANKVKCWIHVISVCQGDQAHYNEATSSSGDVGACEAAKQGCEGDEIDAQWMAAASAALSVLESEPRYEAPAPCDRSTLNEGAPGAQSWEDHWYYSNNAFHTPICTDFPQFRPVVTECQHFSFHVDGETVEVDEQ